MTIRQKPGHTGTALTPGGGPSNKTVDGTYIAKFRSPMSSVGKSHSFLGEVGYQNNQNIAFSSLMTCDVESLAEQDNDRRIATQYGYMWRTTMLMPLVRELIEHK